MYMYIHMNTCYIRSLYTIILYYYVYETYVCILYNAILSKCVCHFQFSDFWLFRPEFKSFHNIIWLPAVSFNGDTNTKRMNVDEMINYINSINEDTCKGKSKEDLQMRVSHFNKFCMWGIYLPLLSCLSVRPS